MKRQTMKQNTIQVDNVGQCNTYHPCKSFRIVFKSCSPIFINSFLQRYWKFKTEIIFHKMKPGVSYQTLSRVNNSSISTRRELCKYMCSKSRNPKQDSTEPSCYPNFVGGKIIFIWALTSSNSPFDHQCQCHWETTCNLCCKETRWSNILTWRIAASIFFWASTSKGSAYRRA